MYLSIILLLIFLISLILFLYYQPQIHNNDLINPCGRTVGGLWPSGRKPLNRICHCDGKVQITDKRAVDGDKLESCLGNGWSVIDR